MLFPLWSLCKKIDLYHDKDIDKLKIGCTLPKLANICLHQFTNKKLYPFTEADNNLLKKIREDVVGSFSIVFTRNVFAYETFIREFTNICKPKKGIDPSQLYP